MNSEPKQITIASGKGGTGKTTVATNLAVTAARAGHEVVLLDCDVEAPNCHLFLASDSQEHQTATVLVPEVDNQRCNGCGECARACEFNALACLSDSVLVFPELCHGCGACGLVCAEKAISQGQRTIGFIELCQTNGFRLGFGLLRLGEAQVPPLIKQVLVWRNRIGLTIVDAPPGTSCSAIAAMRGSDYVMLVTEPTPFGLNDLRLAVETVRAVGLPCGVVVNRAGSGD
ncbi:MAG: ATP-binding protein, partial [bacterium]